MKTVKGTAKLTPLQWAICGIAAIGFLFDTYEILMLPLVVRPAMMELTGATPGTPVYQMWVGRLFYVPAFAGGIVGLLGGYLTDMFGRRRVLTYSILLYAFGAFLSGFASSIEMLLFLRCCVFVGVCVEFIAAVAWLAELFDDPARRERIIGYTQAVASTGGFLVATFNEWLIEHAGSLPAISGLALTAHDPHAPWRYTLMSGVIPAIPLILIRPFLPESPMWKEKRAAGTLKRPSLTAIFSPQLLRTTAVTTIMFAMAYGAAFGAVQQIPQIVPGLPEVKAMVVGLTPPEAGRVTQRIAAQVTQLQEIGGLAGRFLLAFLVVRIASKQKLIRMFQIPGLIVMPIAFSWLATVHLGWMKPAVFLAGVFTVGQFSFWGNYLPRMYPTHLRGTGESFAANIGGRLIGTCFAWVTTTLAATTVPGYAPTKLAIVSGIVGFSVYFVGLIASFWLPEPKQEELPE